MQNDNCKNCESGEFGEPCLRHAIVSMIIGMMKIDKRGVKTCDCTEYEGCGCKVLDYNRALQDVINNLD